MLLTRIAEASLRRRDASGPAARLPPPRGHDPAQVLRRGLRSGVLHHVLYTQLFVVQKP